MDAIDGTDRDAVAVRFGPSWWGVASCMAVVLARSVFGLGLARSVLYDLQTKVKAAAFACLYAL
jgi:hypothetical protein